MCVNDVQTNYLALNLPMGGWKSSGIGTRHGANGIRKYCKTQSLLVTRFGPKRDLWMFPYKRRSTMAAATAVQDAVRPRQRGTEPPRPRGQSQRLRSTLRQLTRRVVTFSASVHLRCTPSVVEQVSFAVPVAPFQRAACRP